MTGSIRHFGLSDIPLSLQGGTVLAGSFDGWHLGHRSLCRCAEEVGLPPLVILTFEPHPRQFFDSGAEPFRLTSCEQKLACMGGESSIAGIVTLPFDSILAGMSAESFISDVLVGALRARHVVLGYDFRFGKGRLGSAEDIRAVIATSVVDARVDIDGEIISSSRIRELIVTGELGEASRLLDRPYAIVGDVCVGDRLGASLGFATANLSLGEQLRPARGVYITETRIGDGDKLYGSITNYGFRPTIGGITERFETHIFDYTGDLYGKQITVSLLEHLRNEEKFADIEALKAQIGRDCLLARDYFASRA